MRMLLLLVLALLFGCLPAKSPDIAHMDRVTVAIVDDENAAHCSGMWVSQDTILTAQHCVEPPQPLFFFNLDEEPAKAEIGDKILYSVIDDKETVRESVIVKLDDKHDLALLKVKGQAPWHPIGHFGDDPLPGDAVYMTGHEYGLEWSYQTGLVSAIRNNEACVKIIQANGTFGPGDSGGPLFDKDGEIVGMADKYIRGSSVFFFIHKTHLIEFIDK